MTAIVTNDFLSDLHQKKQSAIDALDFETAEYYYNEIQSQISQRAQAQINEINHDTMRDLGKIQRHHKDVLEDLAEEKRKADARLYSKFQILFQETQDDHIQQLMELEKQRGLTLLEESEREIPEQIELLNQAKKQAILSNFDKAKELRQEARDVGEAELEKRRNDVEDHFSNLKTEMLKRHKEEMDQISELHEKESKDLKEKADSDLDESIRKLSEAVMLLKDRATVRCQAVTTGDLEKKAAATGDLVKKAAIDMLMQKIDDSMKEYNLMPTVVPKLTKSEQMRLTTLCPTRAAMNRVETTPEEIVRRAEAATAKGTKCRTGLKPPSHSSTGLISRAYTATIGKR